MTENPDAPAGSDAGPAAGTATADPPPPPPPVRPPIVRPRTDRVFRGVCAAVGRATGTDPVLWRVLVVVLTVFGGTGLVLYLTGWLLLPEEGSPESEAQRLARGGMGTGATVAVVVLGVLGVAIVLGDGRGIVPLVVVALVAYLVVRNGRRPGSPTGAPAPTGAETWSAAPGDVGPPAWGPPPVPGYAPPPPLPRPPAPRSTLGALTLSATAVVVGLLLLAGALGADGITTARLLAAALLVVGVGLLVGARWGRSRGLVVLATVLALVLSATNSADRAFGAETGDRTWVVDGPAEHRLAAGEAVLDLTELDARPQVVRVHARVGAGELVVLVPEGLAVEVDASIGLGELVVTEDGAMRTADGGGGIEEVVRTGPAGRPDVVVDAEVGVGQLEVRSVPAA